MFSILVNHPLLTLIPHFSMSLIIGSRMNSRWSVALCAQVAPTLIVQTSNSPKSQNFYYLMSTANSGEVNLYNHRITSLNRIPLLLFALTGAVYNTMLFTHTFNVERGFESEKHWHRNLISSESTSPQGWIPLSLSVNDVLNCKLGVKKKLFVRKAL